MVYVEVEDVKTLSTLFLVINILLYLTIMSFKEKYKVLKSVDINIRNILDKNAFLTGFKVFETTTTIWLFLILFLYRKNMINEKIIYLIFGIYLLFYVLNFLKNRKDTTGGVYILKIMGILYSLFVIFYLGNVTSMERKKVQLTLFMGLFILQIFFNIWMVIDKYIEDHEDNNMYDIRFGLYISLLLIFWIVKVYRDIKIYRIGEYLITILLLFHSLWVIGNKNVIVSRYQETIFPALLFLIYIFVNYKEFNRGSINAKFVYVLAILATAFLLYIIINTEDKKIKAFVTIFLVVVYNILAIVYGNKGCVSVSGSELLKRILKWTFLVMIIVLILWTDIFRTSIGDNLFSLKDDLIVDNSSDTQVLEDEKKGNNSKNDSQIQKRINRMYENRARRNI